MALPLTRWVVAMMVVKARTKGMLIRMMRRLYEPSCNSGMVRCRNRMMGISHVTINV